VTVACSTFTVCIGKASGWSGWRADSRIIDSQSAKTTEPGGPRGFDADEKIECRKRYILADAQQSARRHTHAGEVQDRAG